MLYDSQRFFLVVPVVSIFDMTRKKSPVEYVCVKCVVVCVVVCVYML